MEEMLERLGLTRNESKVYLILLELGLTNAKPVIDKTKLHRQIVYDAFSSLIEKGLVSFVIKANTKYFKATDPEQFREYFEKKQKELDKQKHDFEEVLSKLKAKKSEKNAPEATVFEGIKGVKSILEDQIRSENKEICTIAASGIASESLESHQKTTFPRFHKFMEERKINHKMIFGKDMIYRVKELINQKYVDLRVLPQDFISSSSTTIYGNKVSIIVWGENPFGILIKSEKIAEAQRKHFNVLWKIAKKI